ncbi:hypothetical protein [Verrucomicrobium spinosum]|uniref:hypothetical protein n=1 Tax=Verrucomicrobium spinosum TaxID=2736 RepID=UPI000306E2E0|nr:hypothetical protein [Verrucomicrobium spinosum]
MGTHNDKGSSDENVSQAKPSLGRTLRQFWIIAKAFLGSKSKRKARSFLAVLLPLSLAVGGVQVPLSYAGRDFMNDIALTRMV